MREKKKKKFRVSVQKEYYVNGTIEVDAVSAADAEAKVNKMMHERELQTNDRRIEWDEPQYVDWTFNTTGEVDEV